MTLVRPTDQMISVAFSRLCCVVSFKLNNLFLLYCFPLKAKVIMFNEKEEYKNCLV